jgi:methylated-DNA-[protein]-cysteine S-methyltransferase
MTTLHPPTVDPTAVASAAARFTATADPDVSYALVDSPVGTLVAAVTPAGLVRLAYQDFNGGLDVILEQLAERVSPRILERPDRVDDVRRELDEYFTGRREHFDVPLDWTLTSPFQREILRATFAIPCGQTRTYGEIAAEAGSPGAARAAGTALGRNPIPVIVPCHRILRGGGALGGYTGGLDRKRLLLGVEGAAGFGGALPI